MQVLIFWRLTAGETGCRLRVKRHSLALGGLCSHEIPRSPRIGRPSDPQLQQAAGLDRQNIQRHLQFRNGRANFRVVSDLLLQRL